MSAIYSFIYFFSFTEEEIYYKICKHTHIEGGEEYFLFRFKKLRQFAFGLPYKFKV